MTRSDLHLQGFTETLQLLCGVDNRGMGGSRENREEARAAVPLSDHVGMGQGSNSQVMTRFDTESEI